MSKKYIPIRPNEQEVASFRAKLKEIVRRVEKDIEIYLMPLIEKMVETKDKQQKEQEAVLQKILKRDSIEYLTAYEAALRLHVLKSKVIQEIQKGNFPFAILKNGNYLIPEKDVYEFGVKNGYIKKDPLTEFNHRVEMLQRKYSSLIQTYRNMSKKFTENMYETQKKKFIQQFESQVGIDILSILSEKGLRETFDAEVAENVSLVKGLPENCFSRLQILVTNAISGDEEIEGGLTNAIKDLISTTKVKAKLIARDQSAKAISTFNSIRFQNIGSKKYIWRNSQDNRVAGNPGGLYPDVNPRSKYHGNHWDREGKIFSWDNPPPDGNPGMAINCRCYAEPIFEEIS